MSGPGGTMQRFSSEELARLSTFFGHRDEVMLRTLGNRIWLFSSAGAPIAEYDANSSGFDSAGAAAAAGDVIYIPAASIGGNHTLADGVAYVGLSRTDSVLTGTITGASNAALASMKLNNVSSGSAAISLQPPAACALSVHNCHIEAENTGSGDAYAVNINDDGDIHCWDSYIYGNSNSGSGFAAFAPGAALSWGYMMDFEEGDFSDADSVTDSGSYLSVTAGAAISGSYGLAVAPSGSEVAYVQKNVNSNAEGILEFQIDDILLSAEETFGIIGAADLPGGPKTTFYFTLRITSGSASIRASVVLDSGSETDTSYYGITSGPHTIAGHWKASTGIGNDDGFLKLYIDDELQETLSGLDTDTMLVDEGIYGGLFSSAAVTFSLDQIRWSTSTSYESGDGKTYFRGGWLRGSTDVCNDNTNVFSSDVKFGTLET